MSFHLGEALHWETFPRGVLGVVFAPFEQSLMPDLITT